MFNCKREMRRYLGFVNGASNLPNVGQHLGSLHFAETAVNEMYSGPRKVVADSQAASDEDPQLKRAGDVNVSNHNKGPLA